MKQEGFNPLTTSRVLFSSFYLPSHLEPYHHTFYDKYGYYPSEVYKFAFKTFLH